MQNLKSVITALFAKYGATSIASITNRAHLVDIIGELAKIVSLEKAEKLAADNAAIKAGELVKEARTKKDEAANAARDAETEASDATVDLKNKKAEVERLQKELETAMKAEQTATERSAKAEQDLVKKTDAARKAVEAFHTAEEDENRAKATASAETAELQSAQRYQTEAEQALANWKDAPVATTATPAPAKTKKFKFTWHK